MMAAIQIFYLAINLIGIGIGLALLPSSDSFPFIADFFSFVRKRFGNIGLVITSIVFIFLFIPTISFMAIVFAFMMIWGEHSR